MTDKEQHPAADLRELAEAAFRERAAQLSPVGDFQGSPEAATKMLHELRVHQIELEMQNEELRRAQVELDAARARYFDLYDLAPVGYCTVSDTGLILEANLTAAALLGVARGVLVNQLLSRFILKEDQDNFYLFRKRLDETGDPQSCELRMVKSDGTPFWAHLATTAAEREGGAPEYRIALSDMTEHRRATEVLAFLARTSSGPADEPFFGALARYLAGSLQMDFVCIDRLETDGLLARTVAVWCDGKFEDNVTYALKDTPCGDAVGQTVCCFPASVCQFFPRDQVLQDLRAESYVGVTLWSHTGQPIGLIAVIGRRPLADRSQAEATLKLVAVRAAAELERLDAEAALRASEELFAKTFRSSPQAVTITALDDGKLIDANDSLTRTLGYSREEVVGHTTLELGIWTDKNDRTRFVQTLKEDGFVRNAELELRTKAGDIATMLVSAELVDLAGRKCILSTFNDITARKRAAEEKATLEAQFQQAQKMELVGRLAGGVAHNFNNMLGAILGYVELAVEQVDPTQPLFADLMEIRTAAEHSAQLTRQLLAFARKEMIAPKVLDLNEAVAGTVTMLARLIGEDTHLEWQPAADLWPVKVDRTQIDQILVSLCVNARDAIADVGTITIATGRSTFDDASCAANSQLVPGEFVWLTVSDNGCGMDKETLAHIFEPFFTTKGVGEATGLGLATAYGAVKQNGGFIHVDSEPGKGTTVTIYLPRHLGKIETALVTSGAAGLLTRGQETILLVEDEPAILELAAEMLARQGYTVLTAGTPGDAIRLAREHAGAIHLLLTDVVMPEMNGRHLATRVAALRPDVKSLFMSGYTADIIEKRGVMENDVHFIQKPFSATGVAAKVREVLDGEQG